jgi:hypothetical protein
MAEGKFIATQFSFLKNILLTHWGFKIIIYRPMVTEKWRENLSKIGVKN